MDIVFKAKNTGFYVKLNDSPAALEISDHLPLKGTVSRWGDEIYFDTGIFLSPGELTMDLQCGDVAYWPQGKCLCVFFGRTGASVTNKPVPASPVAVIGRTMAAADELRQIKEGEPIEVCVTGKAAVEVRESGSYDDNRKLSQEEIDALVKRLLAQKSA